VGAEDGAEPTTDRVGRSLKQQGRQGARRSATVSLDVRAEGNSQVLIITPYDEEESVYKPRRPGGIARSDSMDSLNVMSFETVTVNEKPTLNFSLNFEGIGISIINRHLQELVYMSFRGLKIAYTDYPQYYEASLDCKWIQIDNQRFGNTYPMVLYPTVVPKDGKELESHPTLQLSAAVLKDEGENFASSCFIPRLARRGG
jgi:vacuolar protein sorting-associated protein 13A/C